jgi:multidrug resistance efflux pump
MTTNRASRWLVRLICLAGVLALLGGAWRLAIGAGGPAAPLPADPAPHVVMCFGDVDVDGGVTPLSPAAAGRVEEVLVRDGQAVAKGAVLLRLDDRAARLRVSQAEIDLRAAREQREQAAKAPAQHRARLEQQQGVVRAAEHRLAAARQVLERKKELERAKWLAAREVGAAEEEVGAAEAAAAVERARLSELQLADPEAQLRRAEADVEAKEAQLALARQALDDCALTAPAAGTVLRVLVGVGAFLGPQTKEPPVLFCPAGPRLVRAEVPQEFARGLKAGQRATVRDDSSDGPAWVGRVVRLSDWYARRRAVLPEPGQPSDARMLECLIELQPSDEVARIGQRMRVEIAQ